jgi:HSP20 family protein
MYQTNDAIIIKALVAGVSPADLDISITRDMVTLRGIREEYQETNDDNYFHRELFWGSFARTLVLPEEVVIDEAEAQEKHGLLEIRLPKLDKHRSTQLKVRSSINIAK